MLPTLNYSDKSQSGFTLIEIIIVVAIIGVLAAIATISYQDQVRKTQIIVIYQTLNEFRMPYQILLNDGEGVTDFSPSGLNMPIKTQYCQFGVTPPNTSGITHNAVHCEIQNLSYLKNQYLSLDREEDGSWSCRASIGIAKIYLPEACQ